MLLRIICMYPVLWVFLVSAVPRGPYYYDADSADGTAFVVKLRPNVVKWDYMRTLTSTFGSSVEVTHDYYDSFFHGFAVKCRTAKACDWLKEHEAIDYLAEDCGFIQSNLESPSEATYAQARLSSRSRDIRRPYQYRYAESAGKGVDIYVIDSGINTAHNEFRTSDTGSSSRARCGFSVSYDNDCSDKFGHGTAVASGAAGLTVGIANQANIIGVKITRKDGGTNLSDILAGLSWVYENVGSTDSGDSVVNLSMNVRPNKVKTQGVEPGSYYWPLNEAITSIIRLGVHFVNSAGNRGVDACQLGPKAVGLIKVGALSSDDQKADWSCWGPSVTFWAPGEDLTTAWTGNNDAMASGAAGTSMSAPYVAGVVAIYLSEYGRSDPEMLIKRMKHEAYSVNGVLIPQVPQSYSKIGLDP